MALVAPKTILIRNVRPSKTGQQTSPLATHIPADFLLDSDSQEMESGTGTRKRKRLTHLSPEERMLRRYTVFESSC